MTGERVRELRDEDKTAAWCELSLPQPGGRPPAPGDLVLVQSFINSHYDLVIEHGCDLLAGPAALVRWFARRGLMAPTERVDNDEVRRVIAAREGLRALASANRAGGSRLDPGALASLNRVGEGALMEVQFGQERPRFVAAARQGVDRALGVVLALTAEAMIDGSWSRLKACPGEDCGWVFYDHSRNLSGRWCSMSACGGRAKARSHYRRRRGGS